MDTEQVGRGRLSVQEILAKKRAERNAETLAKYGADELSERIADMRRKAINGDPLDDEAYALYETLTDDEKRDVYARSVELRLPGIREKFRTSLDVFNEQEISPLEWRLYEDNTTPQERDEDSSLRGRAKQAKEEGDKLVEEAGIAKRMAEIAARSKIVDYEREFASEEDRVYYFHHLTPERHKADVEERLAYMDKERAVREAAFKKAEEEAEEAFEDLMAKMRERRATDIDSLFGKNGEKLFADLRTLGPVFLRLALHAIMDPIDLAVRAKRSQALDVEFVERPGTEQRVRQLTDQMASEFTNLTETNTGQRSSLAAKFFKGWPFTGKT
ncbi:MAG: hypothetical protein WC802_05380 [Patescibacteria group bacterium]